VILDTCALLWVAQGGGALSAAALHRIDTAPVVYVKVNSTCQSRQRTGLPLS
jgi:hypothetical protein